MREKEVWCVQCESMSRGGFCACYPRPARASRSDRHPAQDRSARERPPTPQVVTMAVSFGGRPGRAPTLTHAVRQADEDRIGDPLCDRVQADCLVPLEEFPEQRDAPPTCPVCRRRDPRHRPGPSAREGPTDG